MSTGQFGYCGVPRCCIDPVGGYQILSSYFDVSQVSRQTYIKTMQHTTFEEWIEKRHQRDANLCGAYARPTDERSLVRGGGNFRSVRRPLHKNYRNEAGTKNEPDTYFVPLQKKGWKIDPHVSMIWPM